MLLWVMSSGATSWVDLDERPPIRARQHEVAGKTLLEKPREKLHYLDAFGICDADALFIATLSTVDSKEVGEDIRSEVVFTVEHDYRGMPGPTFQTTLPGGEVEGRFQHRSSPSVPSPLPAQGWRYLLGTTKDTDEDGNPRFTIALNLLADVALPDAAALDARFETYRTKHCL